MSIVNQKSGSGKLLLAISAGALAIGALACGQTHAATVLSSTGTNTIAYTGTVVDYTVPVAGIYDIVAYGANGGLGAGGRVSGGLGAEMGGSISLSANETLEILVGGGGINGGGPGGGGGGGGGSF